MITVTNIKIISTHVTQNLLHTSVCFHGMRNSKAFLTISVDEK